MVYMNKKSFDITSSTVSVNNPDDWFDIDDLIALPIQVLNRKGYITAACCAGYVFDILIESASPNEPVFLNDDYPCVSYIAFKEGVSLPTLPPGFSIGDIVDMLYIERYYVNDSVYRRVYDILEGMEELYEWALRLPDFEQKPR